jgi:hypothetical protein
LARRSKLHRPISARRKQVNPRPRRDARRKATFPLKTNDLRKTGATRVRGLFSDDSHTASYSPLKAPNTAPLKRLPTERREHQEKQPHNDNEKQNQNRRRAKTTSKEKIAARVVSYFRQLEAVAGNYVVYVFTARIHAPLLEGRQVRKNPTTWMQHRVARELKNRLGRDAPFAAVMEWRTEGRPELHCHGVIALAPHEKQRASEALRAAGGPWRDKQGVARQVEIKPPDPNKSFKGAFGLDGWALYCADDSRQTQLELNRRREALDPQRRHFRAPNIIMQSGLQNSRRVSKQTDEAVSQQITPGVSKQLDNKIVSKLSPAIVSEQANREEPMAKSMAERMKDHHVKRKREWAELQAERDALRAEVADLRRQLAERTDPPAIEKAERRAKKSETIDVVATRIGEKFAQPEPVTDPFMAIDVEAILPAPVAEPKPKVETRSEADITDKILADIAAKFHASPVTPRPVAAPKPKPKPVAPEKPKPVAPAKQTETEAKPVADLYKADPEWGAY